MDGLDYLSYEELVELRVAPHLLYIKRTEYIREKVYAIHKDAYKIRYIVSYDSEAFIDGLTKRSKDEDCGWLIKPQVTELIGGKIARRRIPSDEYDHHIVYRLILIGGILDCEWVRVLMDDHPNLYDR